MGIIRARARAIAVTCVFLAEAPAASAQAPAEDEGSILFAPDEEPSAPGPAESAARPSPEAPQAAGPVGPPAPANGAGSAAGGGAQGGGNGAPAESATAPSGGGGLFSGWSLTPRNRIFGRYRVRLGIAQPDFVGDLKYYDQLYGGTSYHPTFAADWFAFDWYATIGLSLRTGFYTDEGKPAKGNRPMSDITPDQVQKDEAAATTLTLLPLQLCLAAEATPFSKKWLVIDGWIGLERLYFQEVRAGSTARGTQTSVAAAVGESQDDILTNKGWKNATVIGLAANILLNPLDEQSASSMRGSMGLASIYLSPFLEIIQQRDGGADFSRMNKGLAFTFESVY